VRQNRGGGTAIAATWMFAGGYLGIWLLFSVSAAVLQTMLAGPAMTLRSTSLATTFLIAAGIYELSPLKSACLKQCRSPAAFLSRHWRPGPGGALRLGMLHGAWCVGCCWLLMALLFVGGVMHLLWILGLAVLVGIEKLAPCGERIGRAAGAALIAWGVVRLAV
jgi:predicted metal-binding membrane protein